MEEGHQMAAVDPDAMPETEVNWAATEAFVAEFGEEEAASQQEQFHKPSWQRLQQRQIREPPVVQPSSSLQNPLLAEKGNEQEQNDNHKALAIIVLYTVCVIATTILVVKYINQQ